MLTSDWKLKGTVALDCYPDDPPPNTFPPKALVIIGILCVINGILRAPESGPSYSCIPSWR